MAPFSGGDCTVTSFQRVGYETGGNTATSQLRNLANAFSGEPEPHQVPTLLTGAEDGVSLPVSPSLVLGEKHPIPVEGHPTIHWTSTPPKCQDHPHRV